MAWGGSFFKLPPQGLPHGGEVFQLPPQGLPHGGEICILDLQILKIFRLRRAILHFPPMVGGKYSKLPPQPRPHGRGNFPPRVSPMGGKFFRKTYFPPTHGGEAGSLLR